jgi:hypothetical protein
MSDRYMRVVSTVIALELLWLSLDNWSRPLSAQPQATPVVITGIRLDPTRDRLLPVVVEGTVMITATTPVKITADEPLPVKSVPYTPADRPGD